MHWPWLLWSRDSWAGLEQHFPIVGQPGDWGCRYCSISGFITRRRGPGEARVRGRGRMLVFTAASYLDISIVCATHLCTIWTRIHQRSSDSQQQRSTQSTVMDLETGQRVRAIIKTLQSDVEESYNNFLLTHGHGTEDRGQSVTNYQSTESNICLSTVQEMICSSRHVSEWHVTCHEASQQLTQSHLSRCLASFILSFANLIASLNSSKSSNPSLSTSNSSKYFCNSVVCKWFIIQ